MNKAKEHIIQIKNIFLYCMDRESYEIIKTRLVEENTKNIKFFSAVAFFGLLIMFFCSFFIESLKKNTFIYIVSAAIVLILYHVVYRFGKKYPKIIYVCMYIFIALVLSFGIALGTFIETNEQVTVSYVLLLFAVPLLFLDTPLRITLVMAGSIVIYCICARMTQSDTLYGYNMSNVLPYGALSMVISLYIMRIKVERLFYNDRSKKLSEIDQMTHMNNRRLYEYHLQDIGDNTDGITVVALDINGLKVINDNLGHQAGDELIIGSSEMIREVFEPYGTCYRTGGDEFMVIIEGNSPAISELISAVKSKCLGWKGEFVTEISISVGAIISDGTMNISELVQIADKYMYEDKAEHYRNSNPNLDKLTGLLNRKSGEGQIDKHLSAGDTGILYLLRVENISSIYESRGTDEGNAILIQIAKQLRHTFREYDVLSRCDSKTFMIFAKAQNPVEVLGNIIARIQENVIDVVNEDTTHVRPKLLMGYDYVTMNKYRSFPELYETAANNLKGM